MEIPMTNQISFPGLGLDFNINRVAFTVFGKDIFWYAIIIITGFILAAVFVAAGAKKRGAQPEQVWDIALYGLIFGLIGARIYYVMFDFDSVRGGFLNIFKIWEGGIAIYGGIIGAAISTYVYCRKKQLSVRKMFDLCCPGLLLGQAIGRWGNFVNAEVYGKNTSLPWGMSINGSECVHPLFLYESVWNLIGFVLIAIFRDEKRADGQVFSFYILWYSFGRLFLEGMRQGNYILYLVDGKLGISQVVAFLGVIFGAFGIIMSERYRNKTV